MDALVTRTPCTSSDPDADQLDAGTDNQSDGGTDNQSDGGNHSMICRASRHNTATTVMIVRLSSGMNLCDNSIVSK